MVQLQNFPRKTNSFQNDRHLPLLNSLFIERFSEFSSNSHDNTFKSFMKWARKSPQLMGFLDIISTDMLSDGVEFKPMNKGSGRNKVINAQKFWAGNTGMDVAQATIYDLLISGIGYNWVGKLSDKQLNAISYENTKRLLSGK